MKVHGYKEIGNKTSKKVFLCSQCLNKSDLKSYRIMTKYKETYQYLRLHYQYATYITQGLFGKKRGKKEYIYAIFKHNGILQFHATFIFYHKIIHWTHIVSYSVAGRKKNGFVCERHSKVFKGRSPKNECS